ncbi:g4367 [Coccomyxa elongata]
MATCVSICRIVLLLCIFNHVCASDDEGSKLVCKSQGDFKLLGTNYPAPADLPFCKQYSKCTCCKRKHAQAFGLRVQSSLDGASLSPECMEMTAMLACRLCDPEVGVGQKLAVCQGTCDAWYDQCSEDFFEYNSLSEHLMPCSDSSLVCSHLKDLAVDGSDLCRKAGLTVQRAHKKCFDGSVPALLDSCKTTRKVEPSRWKELIARVQPLLLLLMMSAVCGGILALFFSITKVQSGPATVRTGEAAADELNPDKTELPPARAAGLAAVERLNRRQS